jgi:Ni/Co efflux regulator RcnB
MMRDKTSAVMLAGFLCLAPLLAHATDEKKSDCKPDAVWTDFLGHGRCYTHGDKAPDPYTRDDTAIRDWKSKGLPAPDENAQWVEISGKYVMINRENSVIKEIHGAK